MSARHLGRGASLGAIFIELLPFVLLLGLFSAVGVLHVTSRVMVVRMGYRLSALEEEGRALAREQERLRLELATLKSPERLSRSAREELGMAPPAPHAVLSVRR